jgi:hypothetical protein
VRADGKGVDAAGGGRHLTTARTRPRDSFLLVQDLAVAQTGLNLCESGVES